jgi:hypothetical protein
MHGVSNFKAKLFNSDPLSLCGQDLDEAMKKSTATWKIAVGHHTMRSVSDHGDTKELLQLLLPVLQVLLQTIYVHNISFQRAQLKKEFYDNNSMPYISRPTTSTSTSTGTTTAWSTLAAGTG